MTTDPTDVLTIPAGLDELKASLEAGWPDQLAALRESGQPLLAVDDLTDRTDADALIPEPVRAEIIKELPTQSAALSLMRQVTMSSKKERQPVLSALPNAYWVEGDTGLKQTSKAEWENQYLEAEELAVLVPVPDAIIDDSDFDIWGELRPSIVEALGAKLDEATLFDFDSPPSFPDSIVTGSIGDLAADIGSEDGVMNHVEEDGFSVNGFAARTGMKAALRGLRDENGGLLFQPSLQAGTPARLYDEPIYYPDGNGAWEDRDIDLIAGDWTKAIIGIRQDVTFRLFTEGVISDENGKVILNLMQQDSSVLRVVLRVGFVVANPVTRKNTDADSRYPFAVLQPVAS
jgi:HK97 family phage major capsid protein